MNNDNFKQAVERHWRHHAPCGHLNWLVKESDDSLQIEVAPVFQEVVGGGQDGSHVWAGFRFDLSRFLAERGILVESLIAASFCTECNETPYIGIRGTYFSQPFALRIHLEPIPGSAPVEVIDMLTGQVRAIEE
jgi:hypothetical protein